jgi:hypothetical protein
MPNFSKSKSNGNWLQSVANFFYKNWLILIASLYFVPVLIQYLKNTFAEAKFKELGRIADDPQRLEMALDEITINDGCRNAAKIIYAAFNINAKRQNPYTWWLNPQNWQEDDEAVFNAIMGVTAGYAGPDFSILADCYYYVSAGRDLTTDCENYLDKKYYNQLTWGWSDLVKTHGQTN